MTEAPFDDVNDSRSYVWVSNGTTLMASSAELEREGAIRLSVGRYMVIDERLRVCHLEQREGGAFGIQWSRAYGVPLLARTYVVGRRLVVVSIR